MITYEEASRLWRYDKNTGHFFWKVKPRKQPIEIGDRAGSQIGKYRVITYCRKNYLEHRLAWLLTYGEFPNGTLDHKDGDPTNNKLENLRLCEHWQNCCNRGISSRNSSGHKGVHYVKRKDRWQATLHVKGKCRLARTFKTKEEAAAAYAKAAAEHHGKFARLG